MQFHFKCVNHLYKHISQPEAHRNSFQKPWFKTLLAVNLFNNSTHTYTSSQNGFSSQHRRCLFTHSHFTVFRFIKPQISNESLANPQHYAGSAATTSTNFNTISIRKKTGNNLPKHPLTPYLFTAPKIKLGSFSFTTIQQELPESTYQLSVEAWACVPTIPQSYMQMRPLGLEGVAVALNPPWQGGN